MIEAFLAKIGEIFAEKATETAIDKAKGTYFTPKMKRILLMTVCACVLLSGIACFFYFGFHFGYSFDEKNGKLTLKKGFLASGEMPAYYYEEPFENERDPKSVFISSFPWFDIREKVVSVVIPDGITNISPAAFAECVNLKNIRLPNSLTYIGDYAFHNCLSLEYADIPKEVASIGEYAFNRCERLESVSFRAFTQRQFIYVEEVSNMIRINIKKGAFCNCISLKSIEIPITTKKIGDSAFENCSSLTDITIPCDIGERAFKNCSSLTSVTIRPFVSKIGASAFENCSSLKNLEILDNHLITEVEIGVRAFYNCSSLTEIYIPDSVTEIQSHAFEGCNNLKSASVPSTTLVLPAYTLGIYQFPEWTEVTVRES